MNFSKQDSYGLPDLSSDAEAEAFVATVDLTQFDLSGMQRTSFELLPKRKQIIMQVSESLSEAVKAKAAQRAISCQRFIASSLRERALVAAAFARSIAP